MRVDLFFIIIKKSQKRLTKETMDAMRHDTLHRNEQMYKKESNQINIYI